MYLCLSWADIILFLAWLFSNIAIRRCQDILDNKGLLTWLVTPHVTSLSRVWSLSTPLFQHVQLSFPLCGLPLPTLVGFHSYNVGFFFPLVWALFVPAPSVRERNWLRFWSWPLWTLLHTILITRCGWKVILLYLWYKAWLTDINPL